MEAQDINVIKTTQGDLHYYREWDKCDGMIVMEDAKTIRRYKELRETHPDADKYGVFFAFSQSQFDEGYNGLIKRGFIKDGDKICGSGSGAYGSKESLEKFYGFYEGRYEWMAAECDPQEVYFYEYNNHESMISWDGDLEAIKIVINIWGADVARTIKRYSEYKSIDDILNDNR